MAKSDKLSKEAQDEKKKKDKQSKDLENQRKKSINKAKKRIDQIVTSPFKILFNSSIIIALISFVYLYFGKKSELTDAIVNVFIIFCAVYLIIGITLVIYFYIKSEEKIRILTAEIEDNKRRKLEEEKIKHQQEMEELEAIEREMLDRRNRNREDINPRIEQPNISNESQINNEDYMNEILDNNYNNNEN